MTGVTATMRTVPPSNETLTNVLGAQDAITKSLLEKSDFSVEDMGKTMDSNFNIIYSLE